MIKNQAIRNTLRNIFHSSFIKWTKGVRKGGTHRHEKAEAKLPIS